MRLTNQLIPEESEHHKKIKKSNSHDLHKIKNMFSDSESDEKSVKQEPLETKTPVVPKLNLASAIQEHNSS